MRNIIASLVRNLLQVIAGALMAYGITKQETSEFIKASEPVVTGLLLYVVAQVWSFINAKKFADLLSSIKGKF